MAGNGNRDHLTAERRAELTARAIELRRQGLTLTAIGQLLGVSSHSCYLWTRHETFVDHHRVRRDGRIAELRAQGHTYPAIAAAVGMAESSVRRILLKAADKTDVTRDPRNPIAPDGTYVGSD